MSFSLYFTWWNNGASALLDDRKITVNQDGATVAPASDATYPVTDGVIEIDAQVSLTVRGITETVLHVHAWLKVTGQNIEPGSWEQGKIKVPGKHPLLTTPFDRARAAANGVKPGGRSTVTVAGKDVDVTIGSRFLDITSLWWKLHGSSPSAQEYAGRHGGDFNTARFPVLAHTDGTPPLIWFAVIPDKCKGAAGVGRLTFFRPGGTIDHPAGRDGIADRRHAGDTLSRLMRYVLTPSPSERFTAASCDVKIGFEEALERSDRAVVLLLPWPCGTGPNNKIPDYGIATSADLTELSKCALDLLCATGRIAEGKNSPHGDEPRQGVAGFSGGGSALWQAVSGNAGKIHEIYDFDSEKPVGAGDSLNAAFWARRDLRFRIVWGFRSKPEADGLRSHVTKGSVHPPTEAFTAYPVANAASAWWKYLWDNSSPPPATQVRDARHQFAMCGGEGDPSARVTFLEQFLRDSSFLRGR